MDFRRGFGKIVATGVLAAELLPGTLTAQNERALAWSDVADWTNSIAVAIVANF